MNKPPYRKGLWRVMGWCCRSGCCIDCHARGNHGSLDKRQRVVITDNVSPAWARYVATNWQSYGASAERMP